MNTELSLRVRETQGRLDSHDIVKCLPSIPNAHPFASEWRLRSASASRLIQYLSRQSKPVRMLDLGCGNGWLSNQLHKSGHDVTGVDQNHYELKQAARLFSTDSSLLFLEADIFSA